MLRCVQVQDKLEKITNGRSTSPPVAHPGTPTPRSSTDTRSHSSHGGSKHRDGDQVKPRAEDMYEILCNDLLLPLDMTLAAVRQFVWKQNGELTMHYRRKTKVNSTSTSASRGDPSR